MRAFALRSACAFVLLVMASSAHQRGAQAAPVGELTFVSATLDDSLGSCDSDGFVDRGEYGRFSATLQNTGSTTLDAAFVSLAFDNSAIWFPYGATAVVPALTAGASTTVSVVFAYPASITGMTTLSYTLTMNNGIRAQGTQTGSFITNIDDIPAASQTDTVEQESSTWLTAFSSTFGNVAPWTRVATSDTEHAWHVDDPAAGSDQYLISPVMTVDASGYMSFGFDHSWAFEYDSSNYDGGVVEISVNGGAYTDMDTSVYNGTILSYVGDVNPLKGRAAFVKSSSTVRSTLRRSVAAGSSVQVRIRAASDGSGSSTGWTIDNIAVTGIVETPFPLRVAESATCNVVPSNASLSVTLTASASAVDAGGTVDYTLVARNAGSSTILGAHLLDGFPAGLSCTWSCTGQNGASCTASGSGDIAEELELPGGASATYAIQCSVPYDAVTLSNVATISPPDGLDEISAADNTASVEVTVTHTPAKLGGSQTVAGDFVTGGTVTYTLVITNSGSGAQHDNAGDEFVEVLPSALTLISASASAGTATADAGGNVVTWNGEIAAGSSVTVTFVATITASQGATVSAQGTIAYDSTGFGANDATAMTDASACP